jgi:hypothetical protein
MVVQGTVVSASRLMAVVMTENNNVIRIKTAPNFTIGEVICASDRDLFKANTTKRITIGQFSTIAACLILALGMGFSVSAGLVGFRSPLPVAAVVTVDINPSVKLAVSSDGKVVKIEALNPDAASLNLNRLVGKPLDKVVESIVQQATSAGFINPADGILDYVVVSTVNLAADVPMTDKVVDT